MTTPEVTVKFSNGTLEFVLDTVRVVWFVDWCLGWLLQWLVIWFTWQHGATRYGCEIRKQGCFGCISLNCAGLHHWCQLFIFVIFIYRCILRTLSSLQIIQWGFLCKHLRKLNSQFKGPKVCGRSNAHEYGSQLSPTKKSLEDSYPQYLVLQKLFNSQGHHSSCDRNMCPCWM